MTSHPITGRARPAARMCSLGLAVLLLAGPATPAHAQACQLSAGFAQLAAQIPDRVGVCQGAEVDRVELGEATQPTSTGRLVYHTLDGVISFTDGSHTWVLDPSGQAQVRDVNERFPFEFNGDGLPLVGQPGPQLNGLCPTTPVRVLAVENFHASLVNQLGGQCVITTTILSDPDADPHEFQPTASDVRAFHAVQLVVENGLGYDVFSDKILATLPPDQQPAVVKAGDVVGLPVGANPHVWYSAGYVDQIRAAILVDLKQLSPGAAAYYDAQSSALDQQFSTYHTLINQIASTFGNTPIGATESIFVDMAYTTGLNLSTPPEFMQALSEGNDPAARDIATFQNQIQGHQIQVLVYNTQTAAPLGQSVGRRSADGDSGQPRLVGRTASVPHAPFAGPTWDLVQDAREIFAYGFMQNAFMAGTLVAIMGGVIGYFVVLRRLAFATEALSHGGFAGATGAVLIHQDVFLGLLAFTTLAGSVMGILGDKLRGRDVAIGATLACSLALGSLFLTVSTKLAGEAVNILFGNILAIAPADVRLVLVFAAVSLLAVGVMYRPLLFASLDPDIAEARGLPVRGLGVAFMILLGFAVATAVQVVGVLLIFALLILPAAAAQQLTPRPSYAIGCAVAVGVVCVWLGLLIGFYLPYPPSFFITTLTFLSYLATRRLGTRHLRRERPLAASGLVATRSSDAVPFW